VHAFLSGSQTSLTLPGPSRPALSSPHYPREPKPWTHVRRPVRARATIPAISQFWNKISRCWPSGPGDHCEASAAFERWPRLASPEEGILNPRQSLAGESKASSRTDILERLFRARRKLRLFTGFGSHLATIHATWMKVHLSYYKCLSQKIAFDTLCLVCAAGRTSGSRIYFPGRPSRFISTRRPFRVRRTCQAWVAQPTCRPVK